MTYESDLINDPIILAAHMLFDRMQRFEEMFPNPPGEVPEDRDADAVISRFNTRF